MKSLVSRAKPKTISTIFFILGLALFGYLIFRLNPDDLWQYLQKVGWNFLWILLLALVWYFLYAVAWWIFLKEISSDVRFSQIFRIKVSGEAVNTITPFSWGGGDPVRVYLLKAHVPLNEGTASVVVDRTLNNFAVALYLILGAGIAFVKFQLPLQLKIGLITALIVLIGASIFLYIRSHEGLLEFFLDVLRKLRLKRHFSEKTLHRVREIDGHISHFYRINKKGFALALGLHFLVRLLSPVEVLLASKFLGFPLSYLDSYLLISMSVLINMIFVFVPGSIGVMEGAYAGVFSLLHLNPLVGASIQIVRRLRMVFWVAVGFFFMYLSRKQRAPLD